MHDNSLSQFGTATSIKSGGIKLGRGPKQIYFLDQAIFRILLNILFLGSFPVVGFGVIMAFLIGTWTATGVMATKWDVPVNMFDTW